MNENNRMVEYWKLFLEDMRCRHSTKTHFGRIPNLCPCNEVCICKLRYCKVSINDNEKE